uniref:Cytochrome n=1 Tax=Talaromyces marneffei PM1 TaxID=1077442 RepID=A0A093UUG3_TALMA
MNPARRILKTPRSAITLFSRQIDIQTSQPLRNIAERRCLLNALQKFGEVATFLPDKGGDKSKISAIYETSEAASKAVDASPLTLLLPQHPPPTPSRVDTPARDVHVNANVTCAINPATYDHEKQIDRNPWNNIHTGYAWDGNNPVIKDDTRIQDVIAAGARELYAILGE